MTEIKEATSDQDLVERLRKWTNRPLLQEAASALTAAQARIAKLEEQEFEWRMGLDGIEDGRQDALEDLRAAQARIADLDTIVFAQNAALREVEARYLGEQERSLAAERERDEALEKLDDTWGYASALDCVEARCNELERERDEARAALKEIATTDNGHAGIIARHALSPSASAVLGGIAIAGEIVDATARRWGHHGLSPELCDAIAAAVLGRDQTGGSNPLTRRLSEDEITETERVMMGRPTPSPSEERYRQALETIADESDENGYDPPYSWARRIANDALFVISPSPSAVLGGDQTGATPSPELWDIAFALSLTQPEGGDVPSEPTSSALGNSDNDHTAGRDPSGPGSREPSPSVSASGFDPSRVWNDALDHAANAILTVPWGGQTPGHVGLASINAIRALRRVSDGSRAAGETVGLDPQDDSAVGVAETPSPSDPVGAKE